MSNTQKPNGFVKFAKNCMHALKEMSSPTDTSKSPLFYKEIGLIIVLALGFAAIGAISTNFTQNATMPMYNIAVALLLFMTYIVSRNIMIYIDTVVQSLINPEFRHIVDNAKACMDETCCIPGDANDYKKLMLLGPLLMLGLGIYAGFLAIQTPIVNQFFWVATLFPIAAFAAFVHSDKRLYEISKLTIRDGHLHDLSDEKRAWLLHIKEIIRKKFIYISMPGFVASTALLAMVLVVNIFQTGAMDMIFIHGFMLVGIFFIMLTNQIAFRILLVAVESNQRPKDI